MAIVGPVQLMRENIPIFNIEKILMQFHALLLLMKTSTMLYKKNKLYCI